MQTEDLITRSGDTRKISVKHLSHLPLFRNVHIDIIEKMVRDCPVYTLNKNDILTQPGSTDDRIYLILLGKLKIYPESMDVKSVIILEAGECAGELSPIDRKASTSYVVAESKAEVLALNQDIFWRLVDASHGLAHNVLVMLAQKMRHNANQTKFQQIQKEYPRHDMLDAMTGLPNRRWLNDALRRQIMRCSINQRALSVLLLRIDNMETYAREFGQEAEESACATVAQTLMANMRSADQLARFDRDSFMILLPDADEYEAEVIANRFHKLVRGAIIIMPDDSILPSPHVSTAIGQTQPFQTNESLLEKLKNKLGGAERKAELALH